jgi:ubiquinone/menaquinone biosynthesis C-methylase UbiE
MTILRNTLMRTFGRPEGILGRLGGLIMSHMNRDIARSVIAQLKLCPNESVLEVGFGPGVGIALLASSLRDGHVAGVDPSPEMCAQAQKRNADAIASGRVDLRQASVEQMPYGDAVFDAAMSINSMQLWPDRIAGLREIARVLRAGGRIALGFTVHSGQNRDELAATLSTAGFMEPRMLDLQRGFLTLASNR